MVRCGEKEPPDHAIRRLKERGVELRRSGLAPPNLQSRESRPENNRNGEDEVTLYVLL